MTSAHDEFEIGENTLYPRLAAAMTPLAPPAVTAARLRERLAARVATSHARHHGVSTLRAADAHWQAVGEGVRAWVLHDHGHSRSALLRFEPGASIPGHRHATHEECFVLAGSLEAGAVHVGRHDFHLAPAGSRHAPITSREGGVALLRGTSVGRGRHMLREYLAGFLPGAGAPAVTLRAQEGEWRDIGAGVQVKSLWHDGAAGSALLRLQARACFSPATGPMASEYLILDGEAFIGDILLREGEFQHQPAATGTFDIASESGMLCFVHGGVEALGA